jgi:hypothetical protein
MVFQLPDMTTETTITETGTLTIPQLGSVDVSALYSTEL